VPQAARDPEKIGLIAGGVGWSEVRQLQGVGDGVVLYGVVGGVSADIVSVDVEQIVQVIIKEVARQEVEVQRVADSSEIVAFFVFDIEIVSDLKRMSVDFGAAVAEHHGETGQVVGDRRVMPGISVGEIRAVLQPAVFRELAVVENVCQ